MIELIGTRTTGKRQVIYFKIIDGQDQYEWQCGAPLGVDPLDYVTGKEEIFLEAILKLIADGKWDDSGRAHKVFKAEDLMDNSDLLAMTDEELDDYLVDNWKTFTTSKATFKKLFEIVKSMAQRMDWSE